MRGINILNSADFVVNYITNPTPDVQDLKKNQIREGGRGKIRCFLEDLSMTIFIYELTILYYQLTREDIMTLNWNWAWIPVNPGKNQPS
jgi:hypothetical protein